jgi:uncharacterized protein
MPNGGYEAEYVQGVAHFNAHEFFEAHEVWEDIWARTTGRHQLFYKGLIHAAVALHHFGNRNLRGARKVWGSCSQYLTAYTPHHLGLNVAKFLVEMQDCFASIEDADAVHAMVVLDESKIPQIQLDPAPDSDPVQE